MDYHKSLSILAILLFFNFNYSQTGPGGVGNSSSNGLWLSAENITLADSTPLNTWTDASGNNNHATASVGEQPLFLSASSLNNMPTVRLDGINDQMVINDANILDGTNGITYFAVIRPNNLNGNPRGILGKRTSFSSSANYAYTWFFWNNNYLNLDLNTQNNRFNSSPTTFSNSTNYILQMHFNGALPSAQRSKIYSGQNLEVQSSESSTSIINSSSNLVLGALNYNYGTYLGADITELIHYNYALNSAEQIIVNNYLSAKYNIPLTSEDYYNKDDSGNGDFDYHVAGIGQASDGSNHADSQGTGIVRISNPTALSDDEFLFWGEETQNPTYSFSTNTNNYTEQLNSRWRVSRRGNIGTVTVSFDISGINLSGKQSCQPLQLVIDNNANLSSPAEIYDLTIVGNTATATGVLFRNNNYFTLRYADKIVWDGSNYYNGSGSGNAPDNTNECLKLTVKAGGIATLTSDAHVREVEVETGSTLNVANGILLEVENQVDIDGTIDLLGEAQLIQNHTGITSNSGSGSLISRQEGTSNLYNYNYWSAPVNRSGSWQIGYLEDTNGVVNFTNSVDANPLTTPITLSSRWLYGFKGPANDYNAWTAFSTSSNIAPAVGFTMKGSGTATSEQEFIFRGLPNDGDYTFPVSANTEFLVGNPYPSAIDSFQFILDNLSIIDGALYFWESFTTNNSHYLADYEGGYATRTLLLSLPAVADLSGLTSGLGSASKPLPTRYIGVGQGFFTNIVNSGTLAFNNGQRSFARESASETIYYKSRVKNKHADLEDDRPKLWFSFTSPKNYQKTIGLGYDVNTTHSYDKGYDAKPYDNLKNDIYWLQQDNEKLIIQALPEINIEDNLHLGTKIEDAGIYKFSISNMENIPNDLDIYLVDNLKNTYYDLRKTEAELFLEKGSYQNRLSIIFQEDDLLETISYDDENIFASYHTHMKTLELHFKEPITEIENLSIYNTLGQEVISNQLPNSKRIDVSQLNDGVYILKLNFKNTENLKSIKFIKY